MASPYLIQRVVRKRSEFNNSGSIDDNFKMSYMGSAEFEFGALPKSLKHACSELDSYKVVKLDEVTDFNEQPLRVFCPSDDEEYKDALTKMSKDEYSIDTKEFVGLAEVAKATSTGRQDTYFWWDIEHHVFFCFGKTNMKHLRTALENTRNKFKEAGRI